MGGQTVCSRVGGSRVHRCIGVRGKGTVRPESGDGS